MASRWTRWLALACRPAYTPLPSLELGIEPVAVGVDGVVGLHACLWCSHCLAWAHQSVGQGDPSAIGLSTTPAGDRSQCGIGAAASDRQLARLGTRRCSVEFQKFNSARADQQRLSEYLESIHSVEQRLDSLERTDREPWQPRSSLDAVTRT